MADHTAQGDSGLLLGKLELTFFNPHTTLWIIIELNPIHRLGKRIQTSDIQLWLTDHLDRADLILADSSNSVLSLELPHFSSAPRLGLTRSLDGHDPLSIGLRPDIEVAERTVDGINCVALHRNPAVQFFF